MSLLTPALASGHEARLVWLVAAATGAGLALLAVLGALRARRRARRRRLRAAPFPGEWRRILERNVPMYRRMPPGLRADLEGHVNVFLDEKEFTGCAGLEMTDEIRVTVAAQACILLLGRRARYFPGFTSIYVYPSDYVADAPSAGGGVESQNRLGESWQRGPVVLSWCDALHGARDVRDGRNVVLHEFAHKLDEEDGEVDGAPLLESRSRYAAWARALLPEYEKLVARTRRRKRQVIDAYGATNPPEFFAELTVAFFEKPRQLKKKHPELYEEVRGFYQVDPLEWRRKPAAGAGDGPPAAG
jgi:Mlc titration factor MtfA (ptsG expression regulator)